MNNTKTPARAWKSAGIVSFVSILILASWSLAPGEGGETSFFEKSLHYTGEGMRYWYEEQGGFMEITKIPYSELGCKKCHVKTCDQCHAEKKGEKMVFSADKAKSMATCKPCHGRELKTFTLDTKSDTLDVHIEAGMACTDCHSAMDVHGDGRFYKSMRSPGAVLSSCEGCHAEGASDAPEFDPTATAHGTHKGKLDCAACHVSSTMACYNCHFDSALKEGKKGNFIPMKSWLLLINHEGKVTSGSAMSLIYKNKPFIAYVPYFTHSVMGAGRDCSDCHANEAVERIEAGKKVPVVAWKDGEIVPWEGVVPVVPESLAWTFFNKGEGTWIPVEGDPAPKIQFAAYGEPLTKEQLEKLAVPQKVR